MVKFASIILVSTLLSACSSTVPKVETQIVSVPTLYCPPPPEDHRPSLPINTIGKDDDIGTAAVKYKATVRALLDYAERQEKIIEMYKTLSEISKDVERPKTLEIKEIPK